LKGHNKGITALTVDKAAGHAYAGSSDGRVSRLHLGSGEFEVYGAHQNSVTSVVATGDTLTTVGLDDVLRVTPIAQQELGPDVKLDSAPREVSIVGDISVVACFKEISLFNKAQKLSALPVTYEPLCCSVHPSGTQVAVGSKEGKVHVYNIAANTLTQSKVLDATGSVEAVSYSPDGAYLALGDGNRNVYVFETASDYTLKFDEWRSHTAKVTCLAWTPSGQHVASGALDTNLIVWSLAQPAKRITIKAAHPLCIITKLAWASDSLLVSAGSDGSLRSWNVVLA